MLLDDDTAHCRAKANDLTSFVLCHRSRGRASLAAALNLGNKNDPITRHQSSFHPFLPHSEPPVFRSSPLISPAMNDVSDADCFDETRSLGRRADTVDDALEAMNLASH